MPNGAKEFISEELATIFRVLRESFGMKREEAIEAVYEVLDAVSAVNKELNILSYVHITAAPGKVGQVLERVKELPSVSQAHIITGTYDIIATLKTKDVTELREIITENIHRLNDIYSTATSLVIM